MLRVAVAVGLVALPAARIVAQEVPSIVPPAESEPRIAPLQHAYALDAALAEVYEKVAPAVVVLQVHPPVRKEDLSAQQRLLEFFKAPDKLPEPERVTEGSGFFFRPDGYIMTNHHVIEEGAGGKITALLQDGSRLPAKLVGTDEDTDLAVLKVDGENLPAVRFADSDQVRPGQFALAIGSPYELAYTVTFGIVSALKRGELTREGVYEAYIQTDAAIHPGNSGGPLLNIRGEVIGINTMINGINRGLAFAVPSNMASRVAGQLINTGRVARPWLGVGIITLENEPDLQAQFPDLKTGVVVQRLQKDAPAAASDLKPADVIVKVDGVPVRTTTDLQQEVLRKPIGHEVILEVWRPTPNLPERGRYQQVRLRSAERPLPPVQAATFEPTGSEAEDEPIPVRVKRATVNDLGVSLTNSTTDGVNGVLVEERTDVPGFRPNELISGDRITRLEGEEVKNLDQFKQILSESDASDGLLLEVVRDGHTTFMISEH